MSIDAAPLEVLLLVGLGAWALLGLVMLHDAHRVRRHDRYTERRALRVLEQSMQHRVPDHEVEREQADSSADDPAEHEAEGRRVHARRVAA